MSVRSAAEMPVEVLLWSQEMVYAVSILSSLDWLDTISGSCSCSQRSGSIATHTSPLVCFTCVHRAENPSTAALVYI